jgi:hypothetical protein
MACLFVRCSSNCSAARVGDRERVLQEAKRNKGVTEIVKMPGRGHTLTIDAGWREVAEKALEFVKRST